MHTIYHTDAYVLDERPNGEAGKTFVLFTKDFGLIYASAQGIRFEKSKLRFALQKYSLANIALVFGKTGWRITNAYSLSNIYYQLGSDQRFRLVARIFSLLGRLINGEEKNEHLFDILNNAILFLEKDHLFDDQIKDIECVLVLRILNNLGYVGDHKDLQFFILDNSMKNEHIEEIKRSRKVVLSEINRALKESQL
ncbi:recombination protein O N-terminal domain-containing protein [Candidatus Nomurabacteria bacterium]|nr:recombination protein O N-terminal domain-containing protein [Candidatus Nomurabacteria bacterium]